VRAGYKVNKRDLRALNTRLKSLGAATKKDVVQTLKDFGIRSQFDVKREAPVDTGNLKQNVHWTMLDSSTVQVQSVAIEDGFDYAPVQEFGNIYRSGKPYFYPNIKRNIKRAMVLLRNRIKRNLK
jgi:hypothetical protein